MNADKRAQLITAILATVAIGGAIVFGVAERLADPLSTDVVAAEDPYTHMMLVRGHVRDGTLDAVFPGGTMYPPGMHAMLAATWVYTGLDLYDIFRVGPVVFGGIGILGVALLVNRHAGPLAGSVAALATALAPEIIFRTTMMAPTAVDIAVIPFAFATAAETMAGRRAWGIPTAVLLAFLVVSHPWMIAIFAPLVLTWALVAIFAVWWGGPTARVDPIGVVIVLAVSGASLVAAVTACWGECGLKFDELVIAQTAATLDILSIIIAIACMVVAVGILVFRQRISRMQDQLQAWPMAFAWRFGVAVGLGGAIVLGTVPAVQAGMPEYVDLPRMFGWGVIGLAAVGAAAMPFNGGRAALPLTGLAVMTYPFVIYNPLNSPYWPHRTAVYLGIALVGLAGIGASIVVRVLRAAADAWTTRAARRARKRPGSAPANRSRKYSLGAIATIVGATLMAGTVYAGTPLEYEDGWYRLYPDCEFNEMRDIAEDSREGTVIVAGSWQAKLVMGAFAEDGMDVWYSYEMFTREDRRDRTVDDFQGQGRDVIMVVDRYMRTDHAPFDATYLNDDPWEPLGAWCSEGLAHPRLVAYVARGSA